MKLSSILRALTAGGLALALSTGAITEAGAVGPRAVQSGLTAGVAASAIDIWSQPDSVSLTSPGAATFYVFADGDSLRYQWQQRRPGGAWQSISGARSYILTVQARLTHTGLQYRALISSGPRQVSSRVVNLTVIGNPRFTRQPSSARGVEGGRLTLRTAVSGNKISYRWQRKAVGRGWVSVPGVAKATLTVNLSAANHRSQYRVLASNPNGRITSSVATITVLFKKVRITTQPRSSNVQSGQLATFRVETVGIGARYRWQQLTNGRWVNVAGASGSSHRVRASLARNGATYRVIIANSANSVTSRTVRLGVSATRSDPWKVGSAVKLRQWRVRESSARLNANAWLITQGFGEVPAAGKRLVAAEFAATYVGSNRSDPFYDLTIEFVGSNGRTYEQVYDYRLNIHDISIGTLYPGATGKFVAVVEVPTSVASGSWSVTDTSDYPYLETWFAGR